MPRELATKLAPYNSNLVLYKFRVGFYSLQSFYFAQKFVFYMVHRAQRRILSCMS